jgi:hypothetical protein
MQMLTPWLFERVQPLLVDRAHLEQTPAADTRGNFMQPLGPHADRGGWKDGSRAGGDRLPVGARQPQPQLT